MSCCLCASQFMASPLNHTLSDFGQGPFRPLTSFPKKCPRAKKEINIENDLLQKNYSKKESSAKKESEKLSQLPKVAPIAKE